MALTLLKGQIVPLIEKFEPELESILVKTLQSVKTSNPTEAELFYTNWKKLNTAIEREFGPGAPPPPMTGGEDATGPMAPSVIPEASLPIIEPTGPTGPVISEETGPSFLSETGPTGPAESVIEQIKDFLTPSGPTGPAGGKKHRKRKTAKQHKKRTHRVKHRKH